MAYRTLQTLVDFDLVAQRADGVYRAGSRLGSLSTAFVPQLRTVALPVMRTLADAIRMSVILFVVENGTAVAVESVEPSTVDHHFTFHKGGRTTLDRGAAAYALRALDPPRDDDPEPVRLARERGYGESASEVEEGAFGVAVAFTGIEPRSCLLTMSHIKSRADATVPDLVAAATQIAEQLRGQSR